MINPRVGPEQYQGSFVDPSLSQAKTSLEKFRTKDAQSFFYYSVSEGGSGADGHASRLEASALKTPCLILPDSTSTSVSRMSKSKSNMLEGISASKTSSKNAQLVSVAGSTYIKQSVPADLPRQANALKADISYTQDFPYAAVPCERECPYDARRPDSRPQTFPSVVVRTVDEIIALVTPV